MYKSAEGVLKWFGHEEGTSEERVYMPEVEGTWKRRKSRRWRRDAMKDFSGVLGMNMKRIYLIRKIQYTGSDVVCGLNRGM